MIILLFYILIISPEKVIGHVPIELSFLRCKFLEHKVQSHFHQTDQEC